MPVAWTSGTSPSEAAEVVDPTEYLHLAGMAGTTTSMIGAIQSGNDDLEWVERESNPGPQFRTVEIDVLRMLKQLDIRVPVPVGHLLTISEAANDKLLQQCQKNQKRFTYQRIQRMLKKNKEEEIEGIAPPEPGTNKPEAARVAKISLAEKDHFVRARPVLWKSAECDCEIWGKSFNALIDTGDSVVAISLDTVRRTGRLNSILPQSHKDNYVSADEEAMNIVGVIENVVIQVGRVHVLVNALVKDVHSYSVLLGLPWAMAVGARIHFDSKQLVLRQTGGKPRTVPLRISTRTVTRNSGFGGIGMIRGHDCEANPSSSPDDSSGFEELEYKEETPNKEEWKHLVELFEHETQEKFRVVPGTTRTFHLSLEDNTTVPTETQALWGISHFRAYLYGRKFTLLTDHEPLLTLKKSKDYSGMIGRWATVLQSMDFDIRQRKHERHGNADALTRLHRPDRVPKSEEVVLWNEPKSEIGPRYGQVEILPKE
ncbi:hypothetical protein CBR_g54140 [Chara braunii]|uniref:Reverse transcriptase RNase H-like domain-containing protein n=1 Tax=Chara braunii TaxID=69332 RepID=A0A388MBT5_CHABU|nr:hypothetical protein CBR_g54140 [Chara braunii]|eukprot:GBG92020.1 hypothetical protein CBR_g54140 [Chara braunii]